jgi:hypothetical protein
MSILTIGVGTLDIAVDCREAVKLAPIEIGEIAQSILGNEINAVVGERIRARVITTELDNTTSTLIRATFANRAKVLCSSEAFDNGLTPIYVSAVIEGKIMQGLISWELSIDMTECPDPLSAVPGAFEFLLSSVASPDMGGALVSTPDGSYPGDSSSGVSVGTTLVPPTAACPGVPATVFSATPEAKWLSVELAAGYVVGTPSIRFETDSGGGTATTWELQSTKALLYLRRGGANVLGPWETGYYGTLGGLGWSTVVMEFPSPLNFQLQAGDRLYIELWSRLALKCGQTDDATRQFFYHGSVPGPRQDPVLLISGDIASL